MAKPTTARFQDFVLLVGDGNSPEVFTAPCGLTTKGIDFQATSNEVNVPDCDDPEAPAWVERATKTLSGNVSGSGIMARESFDFWNDWFLSGQDKNVRVKLDAPGFGYWSGRYLLTKWSLKASLGDKVQVDVSVDSDGAVVWTAVP